MASFLSIARPRIRMINKMCRSFYGTRQTRRLLLPVSNARPFSSATLQSEEQYLEHWQRGLIQSEEFYEQEAEARRYFYHIDLQGRLFLEDTDPKNIATSLKSPRFLEFFFKQVRPNDTGLHEEYSHVSPCGREMNFIRSADLPIVFQDLRRATGTEIERRESTQDGHIVNDEEGENCYELSYAEDALSVKFDPSALRLSSRTGRLYHPCPRRIRRTRGKKKQMVRKAGSSLGEEPSKQQLSQQPPPQRQKRRGAIHANNMMIFGLVRSQLAVVLSERLIQFSGEDSYDADEPGARKGEDDGNGDSRTGLGFQWRDGRVYPVLELPKGAENLRGLPPMENDL